MAKERYYHRATSIQPGSYYLAAYTIALLLTIIRLHVSLNHHRTLLVELFSARPDYTSARPRTAIALPCLLYTLQYISEG